MTSFETTPTSSPNPLWRLAALALWALIALAFLAFYVTESWLDYGQLLEPCTGETCNWMALSLAEVDVLQSLGLSTTTYAIYMIGTATFSVIVHWLLAGLILWRYGTTRIGLAVSLALLVIPITAISDANNLYANFPGMLVPSVLLQSLGSVILIMFLYLFPNGRLYPRWAFIPLLGSIIFFVVDDFLGIGGVDALTSATNPWFLILISLVMLGVLFQILRYFRASTIAERQQTKWALLGFLVLIIGFPLWGIFFGGVVEFAPGAQRLAALAGGWLIFMVAAIALPFTLAIAILRYRLWNIDLIIRRTLIYGLLTILLLTIYFVLVIVMQNLLVAVGGQQSPVIIVLSTLFIAALFNPLRVRIQRFINRRFYRQKYDAEQALAAFGQTVREEVDLESLTRELLAVVDETMQPETVAVWLQERSE